MRSLFPWVLFVVACGSNPAAGTDSGTDAYSGGGGGGTKLLTSLDEVCDGVPGLTGRSIVDALMPAYAATYTPTGGTSTSALSLTTVYAGGEIRCQLHWNSCSGCGAPDMPAYLEIDVNAHLETGDGTFKESFVAGITKNQFQTTLSFQGSVSMDKLAGSYVGQIGGVWDTHAVSFSGELMPPNKDGGVADAMTTDASPDASADAGTGPVGATTGNAMEQVHKQSGSVGMGQTHGAGSWK